MPPPPQTPAERLAEIRARWPEAVQLAEPLALTARIEPELVRAVRLALFPRSRASMEAEFYFSPLVEQRTPQWVAIDTGAVHELQARLAAGWRQQPSTRIGLEKVRRIVRRAHAAIPPEIACEETIAWLAVTHAEPRAAIDSVLRSFLPALAAGGESAAAVARWFVSAAKRLPLAARETPAFAILGFAASSVLGGRKIEAAAAPTAETFDSVAQFMPDSAKRVKVWMGLTYLGLHITPVETKGYEPVELPFTNPLLVELRANEGQRLLLWEPESPLLVPLLRTTVTLRTLGRELLTFRPGAAAEERRPQPPVEHSAEDGRSVFVASEHAQPAFVERIAADLRKRGHQVFDSLAGAGCVVAILSRADVNSTDFRAKIGEASKSGSPVIGVIVDRTRADGWHLAATVDFSDLERYAESLEELHSAMMAAPRTSGVPELPDSYSRRSALVGRLNEELKRGSPLALAGPSPEGCRLLAIEYARSEERLASFPDGVVWFRPDQHQSAAGFLPRRWLPVFEGIQDKELGQAILSEFRSSAALLLAPSREVAFSLGVPVFEIPLEMPVCRPVQAAIVLTYRLRERSILNVDWEFRNPQPEPHSISLIQGRLIHPDGAVSYLRWELFYEVEGAVHKRSGPAARLEVPTGLNRLGIQFQDSARAWSSGVYLLEFSISLEQLPSGGLVQRSELILRARELAAIHRWLRAPERDFERLSDQAVGIPVELKEAHSWESWINGERFVEMFGLRNKLETDGRADLFRLINYINDDRDVTDYRVAAHLLIAVSKETRGTFRPIEQSATDGARQSGRGETRYRPRGYIPIGGRENYSRLSQALRMDDMLLRNPEMLLDPGVAYRALSFLFIKGGMTGRPINELPDSERAAIRTMEDMVKASLVPRYPSPRTEPMA